MELNQKIESPKPSKPRNRNKKILDQLIQLNYDSSIQKINPCYLTSFIYHDHISKNIMNVSKDLTAGSSLDRSRSILRLSHMESTGVMKESFDLLKSTRKFHLNSLQKKNYRVMKSKDQLQQPGSSIDRAHDFRLIEKRLVDKYLKHKQENRKKYREQKQFLSKILRSSNNFQQFQTKQRLSMPIFQNLKNNNKQENEQMIQLNKNSKITSMCEGKKISRHTKYGSYFGTKKDKENSCINFYDQTQKQLLKEADHQFKYLVRKNGEFLVTPDINKRVIIKNKNTEEKQQKSLTISKKQQSDPNNKAYFSKQQITLYCFKSNQQQPQVKEPEPDQNTDKHNKKQKIQQKLIRQIESGSYFRVEIQLSVNPSLLLTKDKKNNNNLLHIAVMNNREDIFEMVAKKSREHEIDLIGEKNKYGRNPIELGKILSFFKKKQVIQLIEKIEKEKAKRTYDLVNKIVPK